jgi:hypothetical protein
MPNDIDIMGVYIPPLLAAWVFGLLAATLTAEVLNRNGLAARFSNPPLAFISFVVIYTVLFGSTVFPT